MNNDFRAGIHDNWLIDHLLWWGPLAPIVVFVIGMAVMSLLSAIYDAYEDWAMRRSLR